MKNLIILLVLSSMIASCRKVIDVDLNSSNPVTVIEANYTAEDSTVRVRISKTSNYFGENPPTIDGAAVNITDENGVSQTVVGLGNGEYELTNYVPIFNSDYTLSAIVNGITYTAVSTLPSPTQLLDIEYEYFPGFFGNDPGYACFLSYNDPSDTTNFFFALLSKNGEQFDKVNDFTLSDDRLTDGNTISRPIFADSLFQIGDTVGMELRAVDGNVFDYYAQLRSIADGNGGQLAAPGNPIFFWTNDALGYFNAYSNSRKSVIIL